MMRGVRIVLVGLLVVCLVLVSLVLPAVAADSVTTTIDTDTTLSATYQFQRHAFFAQGRYWVFYGLGAANVVYTSSEDMLTWEEPVTVRASSGNYKVSEATDGTHVYYVYAPCSGSNSALTFRQGELGDDGVITWTSAEVTASAAGSTTRYMNPSICVDSSGYPVIAYGSYDTVTLLSDLIVAKNANVDGTWSTDWSTTVATGLSGANRYPQVSPHDTGQGLEVAWNGANAKPVGGSYDGSSWSAFSEINIAMQGGDAISCVVTSDNVAHYLVPQTSTYNLLEAPMLAGTWQSTVTVYDGSATQGAVVTRTDGDNLVCFWNGNPTTDHIYYSERRSGTWSTPTDWLTDSTLQGKYYQMAPYEQGGGRYAPLYWNLTGMSFRCKGLERAVPLVITSAVTTLTDTTATLPGTLLSTGSYSTTVTMYWGETDGDEVPGDWDDSSVPTTPSQPMAAGAFSKSLTGLEPGTLYYFTAKAVNTLGTVWAESRSFTTLVLPEIGDLVVTLISPTGCRVSGEVLDLGGCDNVTVVVYYGESDGSDNVSAWSFCESCGVVTGVFSVDILELDSGTDYYCRGRAESTVGADWSDNATAWTTLVGTGGPAGPAGDDYGMDWEGETAMTIMLAVGALIFLLLAVTRGGVMYGLIGFVCALGVVTLQDDWARIVAGLMMILCAVAAFRSGLVGKLF